MKQKVLLLFSSIFPSCIRNTESVVRVQPFAGIRNEFCFVALKRNSISLSDVNVDHDRMSSDLLGQNFAVLENFDHRQVDQRRKKFHCQSKKMSFYKKTDQMNSVLNICKASFLKLICNGQCLQNNVPVSITVILCLSLVIVFGRQTDYIKANESLIQFKNCFAVSVGKFVPNFEKEPCNTSPGAPLSYKI